MFKGLRETLNKFSQKAKETISEKEISLKDLKKPLEEFNLQLIKNNVSFTVSEKIIEDLTNKFKGTKIDRGSLEVFLEKSIRKSLLEILNLEKINLENFIEKNRPALLLFMGFNGSGKTTTIAKIAKKFKDRFKIVLAAGDTFRAASIEQLEEHAENLGLKVIKQTYGADAAAVIFDAKKHAETGNLDLILADTAGRAHTNINLIGELEKIIRVNKPDLKILLVDSLVGNDILNQIEVYEKIGFDCTILTKTDVDTRGGTILNLAYLTKKPILYLGTGQDYKNIEEFSAEKVINLLLSS